MKKLLLTTALALPLIGIFPKYGEALVVSDPGQYARMATELNELKKHFEALKDQLEELEDLNSSLSGNLKIGSGMGRDLAKLLGLSENMTKGLHSLPHMELDDYDLENIEDTQKVLDKVYTKEESILAATQTEKQRKDYRQRSIRAALEGSESLIALQQERFKKINELADEIDNTETVKEAIDLNNRLLGEILMVQQTALLLQAQYVRAEQSLKYGYADRAQSSDDPNAGQYNDFIKKSGTRAAKKMKELREDNGWEKPPF